MMEINQQQASSSMDSFKMKQNITDTNSPSTDIEDMEKLCFSDSDDDQIKTNNQPGKSSIGSISSISNGNSNLEDSKKMNGKKLLDDNLDDISDDSFDCDIILKVNDDMVVDETMESELLNEEVAVEVPKSSNAKETTDKIGTALAVIEHTDRVSEKIEEKCLDAKQNKNDEPKNLDSEKLESNIIITEATKEDNNEVLKADDSLSTKEVDTDVDMALDDIIDGEVDADVDDEVIDEVNDKVDPDMNGKVDGKVDEKVDSKVDDKVGGDVDDKVAGVVDDNLPGKVDDEVRRKLDGDADDAMLGKVDDAVNDDVCGDKDSVIDGDVDMNVHAEKTDKNVKLQTSKEAEVVVLNKTNALIDILEIISDEEIDDLEEVEKSVKVNGDNDKLMEESEMKSDGLDMLLHEIDNAIEDKEDPVVKSKPNSLLEEIILLDSPISNDVREKLPEDVEKVHEIPDLENDSEKNLKDETDKKEQDNLKDDKQNSLLINLMEEIDSEASKPTDKDSSEKQTIDDDDDDDEEIVFIELNNVSTISKASNSLNIGPDETEEISDDEIIFYEDDSSFKEKDSVKNTSDNQQQNDKSELKAVKIDKKLEEKEIIEEICVVEDEDCSAEKNFEIDKPEVISDILIEVTPNSDSKKEAAKNDKSPVKPSKLVEDKEVKVLFSTSAVKELISKQVTVAGDDDDITKISNDIEKDLSSSQDKDIVEEVVVTKVSETEGAVVELENNESAESAELGQTEFSELVSKFNGDPNEKLDLTEEADVPMAESGLSEKSINERHEETNETNDNPEETSESNTTTQESKLTKSTECITENKSIIISDNSDNALDIFPVEKLEEESAEKTAKESQADEHVADAIVEENLVDCPLNVSATTTVETLKSKLPRSEVEAVNNLENINSEPPQKRLKVDTISSTDNEINSKINEDNEKHLETELLTVPSVPETDLEQSKIVDDDIVLIEEEDTPMPIASNDSDSRKLCKRTSQDSLINESKKLKVDVLDVQIIKDAPTKNLEEESKVEVEEKRSKPLTIPSLYPAPTFPKTPSNIKLEFLRKFKRSISSMTKKDLEEVVMQKLVESIIHASEFGEMRDVLEKQEQVIEQHRKKVTELTKQFKDLEMVHCRVLKDLETRNQQFIMPVKITRAVGLQVVIPAKSNQKLAAVALSNPTTVSTSTTTATQLAERQPGNIQNLQRPQVTMTAVNTHQTSPDSLKRGRSHQKFTPLRPDTPQNSPLNRSTGGTAGSSSTVVSGVQSSSVTTTNLAQKINALNLTQQQQQQLHMKMQQQQQLKHQQLQQQVMQQQQLLQQQLAQKQLLHAQQQAAIKKATSIQQQNSPVVQIAQNIGSTTGVLGSISVRKLSGGPVRFPLQNSAVKKSTSNIRGPQHPDNKTSPNGKQQQQQPTSTEQSRPTKSVIDLTDEEESPKSGSQQKHSGNLVPALVAIPNQPNSRLATYIVNKPNGIQQQQHLQQQNHPQQQRVIVGSRPPANRQIVSIQRQIQPAQSTRLNLPVSRQQITAVRYIHPAPLPRAPALLSNPSWKDTPPRPAIHISNIDTGIVISWTMDDLADRHADVTSYQIYAYQETSAPPQVEAWRHVGDVKAMLLPMAVTLTQFQEGQRYYFSVRAVDVHNRCGHFSPPKTWI